MWQDIVRSRFYQKYIDPILIVSWYLLMIFVAWETLNLLKLHPIDIDSVNISLPNIISTVGIISAILITFIFSKLYAEKLEIVERKKRMQQLSAKTNAIRKISYILFKKNQFWKNKTLDLGTIINDIDDDYISYNIFNQTKYTKKDLMTIWDAFYSLLPLMQAKPEDFLNIEEFSKHDRDQLIDNMKVINESESIKELDNNKLRITIKDYIHIFLDEHYTLLSLNSSRARRNFYFLMFDLFVFVVLIISGLIFLNISAKASMTLFANQLIVSVFVATVIDILKNILVAVRFEFKTHGIRET